MEAEELAAILKRMYDDARKGETATMVHLFGIRFASEIKHCGASPMNLAKLAGISTNYGTEIGKGIRLSRFVKEK